ncbi:SDR family oxidoreductase [Pendulispora rubella]|uniref:SDR family oxidoreductase n=1 Tax=Pendulispora rubella TaxID=2741070 RepID=A0ABZ2L610_9BACT
MFDLIGKRALVTGASRGIGRAIAVALARHGADVAVNARTEEALNGVAAEIAGLKRNAPVLAADVTDPVAAERLVAEAIGQLGGLDILVNNAGGSYTSTPVPVLEVSLENWNHTLAWNATAMFILMRAAGAHMVEQRRGSIINVSSVGGLRGSRSSASYAAAKATVISMTRIAAVDWAAAGVRVNALCPGWTATDLTRPLRENPSVDERIVASIPMRRWASPEEQAGPALFLASDASSYMTGQTLIVDGGMSA